MSTIVASPPSRVCPHPRPSVLPSLLPTPAVCVLGATGDTPAPAPPTPAADPVEMQILGCAKVSDLVVVRRLGGGQNGLVLSVRCTRGGLPDPSKLYALKMVYWHGHGAGETSRLETEYAALSQVHPHPNLIRFYAQFTDEVRGRLGWGWFG